MKKIFIPFFLFASINSFAQKDSTHAIHFGGDFICAPILQIQDNDENQYNFSSGLSAYINFDNAFELKIGGLYHFIKYSTYDENKYGKRTYTVFNYSTVNIKGNFYLVRQLYQQCFISIGTSV